MMLDCFVPGGKESYLIKQVLKPQQGTNAFIKGMLIADHDEGLRDWGQDRGYCPRKQNFTTGIAGNGSKAITEARFFSPRRDIYDAKYSLAAEDEPYPHY